MNVYMYVDASDLDEIDVSIADTMAKWAESSKLKCIFVKNQDLEGDELDLPSLELGLVLPINKSFDLKEPLNYLFKIAKTNQLNFVVGITDDNNESREDVCYFGCDEGKPDFFEIGTYLGV